MVPVNCVLIRMYIFTLGTNAALVICHMVSKGDVYTNRKIN